MIISGGLAGLGGVFLVFIAGIYREGQTGGRGYIGLAALIFGNWRPGGLAAGAGLFGFADALQLRSRSAVVALLLLRGDPAARASPSARLLRRTSSRPVRIAAGRRGSAAFVGFLTIDVAARRASCRSPRT